MAENNCPYELETIIISYPSNFASQINFHINTLQINSNNLSFGLNNGILPKLNSISLTNIETVSLNGITFKDNTYS